MIALPHCTSAMTQCAGPGMAVGPRVIACQAGSVMVTPATVSAMLAAAKPQDNRYCFAAGTYAGFSLTPHTGDSYIGLKGAVLDGGGKPIAAFYGAAVAVHIENFVIRNYAVRLQHAAVDNRNPKGARWEVVHNEIDHNGGAGVELTEQSSLTGNYIHHNQQEGYACGGTGMRITGNEIAYNNPDGKVHWQWEAGGGKCWNTTGLVVSYNYSHDNGGPGLWTDNDNQNTSYDHNIVSNNAGPGILHEISFDATITNNIVTDNGRRASCDGWLWCAQINLSSSGGTIRIANNSTASNAAEKQNAIGIVQQKRGGGPKGAYRIGSVTVTDNQIDLTRGGLVGAAQDCDCGPIYDRVHFSANRYSGGSPASFAWQGTPPERIGG